MKALVTGSSGHLGEALVRELLGKGHEVRGLDLQPSPTTDLVGSITDRGLVEQALDGIDTVFHTATLHKPHVATHSKQDFLDSNIQGTLNLLEAGHEARLGAFVFSSTTSVYGDALRPGPGERAAWIDEDVMPIPRNIYGVTKLAAENLCQLFHRNHGLACVVLRTGRFFPEEDDDRARRESFSSDNAKVNELLHRRADLADMVSAHLAAAYEAPRLGFGRYVISATTPFRRGDLGLLNRDAPRVVRQYFPGYEDLYARLGWRMFERMDRVYDNARAREALWWRPAHDFGLALRRLSQGRPWGSELARQIGAKGYHDERVRQQFDDGPYPIEAKPAAAARR